MERGVDGVARERREGEDGAAADGGFVVAGGEDGGEAGGVAECADGGDGCFTSEWVVVLAGHRDERGGRAGVDGGRAELPQGPRGRFDDRDVIVAKEREQRAGGGGECRCELGRTSTHARRRVRQGAAPRGRRSTAPAGTGERAECGGSDARIRVAPSGGFELGGCTRRQSRPESERGGVGGSFDGVCHGNRPYRRAASPRSVHGRLCAETAAWPTVGAEPELATAKDEEMTTDSGVPPAQLPAAPVPPRRHRRPLVAGGTVLGILLVVVLVAGALVRLPYVLIAPGMANSVERVVKVDGAPTYKHRGQLLFLTVSVSSDRPTVFALLSGWLDDDTDVVSEDDVLQGRSRAQDERLSKLEMADSQTTAKRVALERLGYTVPVSGQGAVVTTVQKRAPADGKLRVGDVITAVDGEAVTLSEDLGPIVRSHPAGEPVTFTVERDGASSDVTITSRATPEGPCQGRAQIGISTGTRSEKFDFPVDVSIDTGRVSGPSAGLAFTLTILDELTPGDLTGGKKVAVTGTIQPDGAVGPIGGAEQKAITARKAGAKLFLVPTAEVKEARGRAEGMKVVGIRTLDDALRELKTFGGDETGVPPAAPVPQC